MGHIYGIDLGTTNSLIGDHATGFLSEIVPSVVDMENGRAGSKYYEDMSAMRSFKIDMSMGVEGLAPRKASKFVLKELASKVTYDKVIDVVISVPAYFTDTQREATKVAAEEAGLTVRGIVNEPTAAAMYIAQQQKGLFVVFDLGGGTFDVSIIDSRFGMYDVQATSGRVIGGDNFDQNLMKYVIKNAKIPAHHMNAQQKMLLQHHCKQMKENMQKCRRSFEVDFTYCGGQKFVFTPEAYTQIMKLTFTDTINCTKMLIDKNIPSVEAYDILLVGGSTHCPFLQKWIIEVFGKIPAALNYDPDRVVAQGAALYASLVESGEIHQQVSDVTKQLSIGLHDGTVEVLVPANSKIPTSTESIFTNPIYTKSLTIALYQGESSFVKNNEKIGELVWDFDEPKQPGDGQVIVNISIDHQGLITFSCNELLKPKKVVKLRR